MIDNGENDKDPAKGKLKLSGVAWGTYTLKETKAPAGYVKSKESKTVEVDGKHLNVTFGDIINTPEPTVPPTIPTEPTDPTVPPTEPTEPTEPTVPPTEPTVPTEPTEPTVPPTEPTVPSQPTQPTQPATSGAPLAHTGAAVTGLAVTAALLALVGGATVLLSKRRRHQ